jgi:hypothetical protein
MRVWQLSPQQRPKQTVASTLATGATTAASPPSLCIRRMAASPTLSLSLSITFDNSIRGRAGVSSPKSFGGGARYRRPGIPRLQKFEGRGIWYWASPIEARMCRREEIALVGGGNSAGQAAVFLAGFAAKISMLVRVDSLASSMSRYLIDRIEARPNIELLCHTEIVALTGTPEGRLERVRWRHAPTGAETVSARLCQLSALRIEPTKNASEIASRSKRLGI